MKRYRIDFVVRETGVPEDEARGVKFGNDVDVGEVFDFFNRCRDAVVTLIDGERPDDALAEAKAQEEAKELKRQVERLRAMQGQAQVAATNTNVYGHPDGAFKRLREASRAVKPR